jgi:hypothetical protein
VILWRFIIALIFFTPCPFETCLVVISNGRLAARPLKPPACGKLEDFSLWS